EERSQPALRTKQPSAHCLRVESLAFAIFGVKEAGEGGFLQQITKWLLLLRQAPRAWERNCSRVLKVVRLSAQPSIGSMDVCGSAEGCRKVTVGTMRGTR